MYEDVYCHVCGEQVCQECGCCYNPSCANASCSLTLDNDEDEIEEEKRLGAIV
jgi:hypothetical protein